MLFNSFPFVIFFPIVTIIYFLMPHKFRWVLLLSASCVFYMFFIPAYIFILIITILIDYTAALYIEKTTGQKKKRYLIISIISTCLVLFVFKYFNFFNSNFSAFAHFVGLNYPIPLVNIILPIGLSFHTFQSLSYVIEVYRGKQKAEHHFGIYALYVMFYPQLVAGPIERPQNLLHQFYEKHSFEYSRVASGLRLMLWGLFKKVVIADRLASFVNTVYNNPHSYQGMPLIWATLFFAAQIYTDFSGYSDIAIGSARVMGFRLMTNFKTPYLSTSVREFWGRWHISLSTWFRDYVYIPLGGNKTAFIVWARNIMIVFALSGLWHGANWTFIVWGLLHGCYVIAGRKLSIKNSFMPRFFSFASGCFTFFLVLIAWVFFRASTFSDAVYIFQNAGRIDLGNLIGVPLFSTYSFMQMLATLALLLISDIIIYYELHERWKRYRWAVYLFVAAISVTILVWGVFEQQEFIYFQF